MLSNSWDQEGTLYLTSMAVGMSTSWTQEQFGSQIVGFSNSLEEQLGSVLVGFSNIRWEQQYSFGSVIIALRHSWAQ
jgi:hypothetical protein